MLAVGLVALLAAAFPSAAVSKQAPLYTALDKYRIPGRFLVALHPGVTSDQRESLLSIIPSSTFIYTTTGTSSNPEHIGTSVADQTFHTFTVHEPSPYSVITGTFTDTVLDQVRQHPSVQYVEEDQRVNHYDHEYDAPWGLSRISSHALPAPSNYHTYGYAHPAGSGVTAYVIDTGIYVDHEDFGGRAEWGANFVPGDPDTDGNGHGTHVAGTIAGHRYGVAKKASLVAVKVLDGQGSGTMSGVVKGVEFAIQHHTERTKKLGRNAPSVANMSLGGGSSPTLDRAVNAAVKAGIAFAVAAGNDNADACSYSPAASDLAITVGASTKRDVMAYFSNHGPCVDVFAPGDHILSTWNNGNETRVLSGTSMASPHTCGVAALHLSVKCSSDKPASYLSSEACSPAQIKQDMLNSATLDVLAGLPRPGEGGGDDDDWPFPWPDPREPREPEGPTKNALLWVTDPDRQDAEDGIASAPASKSKSKASETEAGNKMGEEKVFHILPLTSTTEKDQPKLSLLDSTLLRSRIAQAYRSAQAVIKPQRDESQEKVDQAMGGNILVKMVDAIFG